MTSSQRYNAYQCQSCANIVFTRDEDEGVTPFMIECRHCGNSMYSRFYTVPDWVDDSHISGVWRKDFPPEYTKFEREISQDHQDKGGLFLHYFREQVSDPDPDSHFTVMSKFKRLRRTA